MINQITKEKTHLLELADSMAAAATSFNSHGYTLFIEARDRYVQEVEEFLNKVTEIVVSK